MWALAAAAIALGAGVIELVTARKRPPPIRALHWVLLRVGVDALIGAVAYPAISAGAGGADGAAVATAAGLAGPAFLRAAIVVERPEGKSAVVGLARRYRRLMRSVNERISQLGAASDSAWVNDVVLPALAVMSLDDLSRRIETYFWALYISTGKEQEELTFVRTVVEDPSLREDEKRRRLVGHLIESGNRVFVQRLLRAPRT